MLHAFLRTKYNPHLPFLRTYIFLLMYLRVFGLVYEWALGAPTNNNSQPIGVTCMNKSQNNRFLLQGVYCVFYSVCAYRYFMHSCWNYFNSELLSKHFSLCADSEISHFHGQLPQLSLQQAQSSGFTSRTTIITLTFFHSAQFYPGRFMYRDL